MRNIQRLKVFPHNLYQLHIGWLKLLKVLKSRNQQEGGLIMQMLHDGVIEKILTYDRTYFPNENTMLMTFELGMATEYSRALAENTKRGQKFKTKKPSNIARFQKYYMVEA